MQRLILSQWEAGYDYSQVGHLPLAGGTLTGALTGTTAAFSTGSTTDHVLRLTDAGVANYDVIFPNAYTYQLTTSAASNKTFKLLNSGTGLFSLDVEGTISSGAITSTVINAGDATLLTLHHDTGADIAQQKSFIDFNFEDDNTNETPQVRIGAEVGQNGNADSQIKEGSGAFVVYTNNATTVSGAATGLNERFRVDYTGDTWIKTGVLKMGTTTVIDAARNITAGTISSGSINSSGIVLGGHGATPTGSVIGNVRSYGITGAYMSASDESGRTAFFGVDSSGYAMFGALTNHDAVIRANNNPYLRVKNNSNVQIVSGSLQMGTITVIDAARNITSTGLTVDTSAGTLIVEGFGGSSNKIRSDGSLKLSATGGSVALQHGATERLETTSTGILVTGTISSGAITSSGTSAINNFRLTDSSKMGFGTVKAGGSIVHTASVDEGIFWHTTADYGIYRTAGAWSGNLSAVKTKLGYGHYYRRRI